jgi:hypothetical protein
LRRLSTLLKIRRPSPPSAWISSSSLVRQEHDSLSIVCPRLCDIIIPIDMVNSSRRALWRPALRDCLGERLNLRGSAPEYCRTYFLQSALAFSTSASSSGLNFVRSHFSQYRGHANGLS